MDKKIYLQLKKQISIKVGQTVYLKDIAYLLCPIEIKEKVEKLVIPIDYNRDSEIITISVIEIIEIISRAIPQTMILSVGEKKVSIAIDKIDKEESNKINLTNFVKIVITCLLLFLGAGLAIMYFHADVNMHQVHETITTSLTGQKNVSLYWINIPYSIGIGIGIALFFGIFSRNKNIPDLLEIEMFKYKRDVESYMEYREDQKSGENE
ncbi:MAG: stage V sporulation protein AA [Caldicoprobacterales bacterium]|jgi:stage V sporulation protein AA|nr:hypothetical protein [Clostridiales bacterium]